MLALEDQVGKSPLDKSLAELLRLCASQIDGSAFRIDMHTSDARKDDKADRRLAAVAGWREMPFFTQREHAALEWTDTVTLVSRDHVSNAVREAVKPYFSDGEIVDLTLLVSAINNWNLFAIAFHKTRA